MSFSTAASAVWLASGAGGRFRFAFDFFVFLLGRFGIRSILVCGEGHVNGPQSKRYQYQRT
jgi:hypothetical protein